MNNPIRTEVFHLANVTDWSTWAWAKFDAEGEQIGASEYHQLKADAIAAAIADQPALPCHIYTKADKLGYIK